MNSKKQALQRKLESEQAQKQELQVVIRREQDYLRTTLQERLRVIRAEQTALREETETEETQRVTRMEQIVMRLIQEKGVVEERLIQEVNQKQKIVFALEKQKNNITQEIKAKIEEIKRHRRDIQVKLGYKVVEDLMAE